jgi:hypothetical protein
LWKYRSCRTAWRTAAPGRKPSATRKMPSDSGLEPPKTTALKSPAGAGAWYMRDRYWRFDNRNSQFDFAVVRHFPFAPLRPLLLDRGEGQGEESNEGRRAKRGYRMSWCGGIRNSQFPRPTSPRSTIDLRNSTFLCFDTANRRSSFACFAIRNSAFQQGAPRRARRNRRAARPALARQQSLRLRVGVASDHVGRACGSAKCEGSPIQNCIPSRRPKGCGGRRGASVARRGISS